MSVGKKLKDLARHEPGLLKPPPLKDHKIISQSLHGIISIGELKTYVCRNVAEKSKGMQVPTARTENIRFDFRVW